MGDDAPGRGVSALRALYVAEGRERLFDRLKPSITAGDAVATTYADVGAELGMSEGAVKVAVHRLRRRYADALRGAVRDTVEPGDAAADELRDLFRSVAR